MTRRIFALNVVALCLVSGYGWNNSAVSHQASEDPRGVGIRRVGGGVAPDGKGQLWAVIIGISSYKNVPPEGQLRYAHRDAEDLAAFLRSPSGGGFPSNHIKLLLN